MTDIHAGVRIRRASSADAPTIAELHAASWRRHYRGAYADAYLDGDVVADRLAVWAQRLAEPAGTLTLLAESAAPPAPTSTPTHRPEPESESEPEPEPAPEPAPENSSPPKAGPEPELENRRQPENRPRPKAPPRPEAEPTPEAEPPKPLAFLHLIFDEDPTWGTLIDNLHVTPSRQRTGVGGRLLMLAADEVVKQAAHPGLYLWVLEQNRSAQSFYQAMGGTIVEKASVSNPGGVAGRLVGVPTKLRCAWPDAAAVSDVART